MRHYVPYPTQDGYAVAYRNHRGEFVAMLECATYAQAYEEAARMTAQALAESLGHVQTKPSGGNRYLRRFQHG